MLMGSVERQLDTKNRIRLSSKFRAELGTEIAFVLQDGAIEVYPKSVIEERVAILNKNHNPFKKAEVKQLAKYFMSIEYPQEDAQGRILLEKRLLKATGIEKDILIVGCDDHLMIVRPDYFDDVDEVEGQDVLADIYQRNKNGI